MYFKKHTTTLKKNFLGIFKLKKKIPFIFTIYLFFVFCAGFFFFKITQFNFFYYTNFSISSYFVFKNPSESFLEQIINLHHDLMFYLIILSVLVFWFLVRINFFFGEPPKKKVRSFSFKEKFFFFIFFIIGLIFFPFLYFFFLELKTEFDYLNLDFQYQENLNFNNNEIYHLGFESNSLNENLICKMIKSGESASIRVGQLINQEGTELTSSFGKSQVDYSRFSNSQKHRFNYVYRTHPKKIIKIFPNFTLSYLICRNVPTTPIFGTGNDFFFEGFIKSTKESSYSSPGIFAWKTNSIENYLFNNEISSIKYRTKNEESFFKALDNLNSPTWKDLIIEAEKNEELIFEVQKLKKKN